jgi:hypothetical protein
MENLLFTRALCGNDSLKQPIFSVAKDQYTFCYFVGNGRHFTELEDWYQGDLVDVPIFLCARAGQSAM